MHRIGIYRFIASAFAGAFAILGLAAPAGAGGPGDLLVAPTRLEINNFRGTEVVLDNIGAETATYRVSLELRRMTEDGDLVEVDPAQANKVEQAALDMIAYAPRRVTLQPNQPQSIRVGVRPPEGLPDGEYRAHLLFRAIPEAKAPGTEAQKTDGISIAITPIYGITIPVFVRSGALQAEARIAGAKLVTVDGKSGVAIDIDRSGNRSVYGDVKLFKAGSSEPVLAARGVAVYPEINHRTIKVAVPEGFKGSLAGPAIIQYVERTDDGPGRILAEANVVLR